MKEQPGLVLDGRRGKLLKVARAHAPHRVQFFHVPAILESFAKQHERHL